jgi:hypothetical protein
MAQRPGEASPQYRTKEIFCMTSTIKRGLGVLALFGIVVFLAAGAHSDEIQPPGPLAAVDDPPNAPPPNLRQQSDPCGSQMMGKMGPRMWIGRGSGMGGPGMMGGGMGMPGMSGMPGMGPGMGMPGMPEPMMLMRMMSRNPKLAGKMMQMHADMMRAMADVLTKYGKEMESGDWPTAKGNGAGDD